MLSHFSHPGAGLLAGGWGAQGAGQAADHMSAEAVQPAGVVLAAHGVTRALQVPSG